MSKDYEDRVIESLDKLLGHRDEIQNAVRKLFNQQQSHEAKTASHLEKVGEMFKGIHARISRLEEARFRGVRAILLVALGASLSWVLHR